MKGRPQDGARRGDLKRVTEIHDPIALELFKNAVFSIADEMALTVFRTTYSGVLKDNMDYSTGFADAEGRLAAQGLTLPGHLGSVPTAMESIMRHFLHKAGGAQHPLRRGLVPTPCWETRG